MKKLSILTLLLAFTAITFGQNAVASQDEIQKFYKTTTCIVYDDDIFNTYNAKIKEAVELNWKITPFEFISMDEFKKRIKNTSYSFLIRTKIMFGEDKDGTQYTFLSLVNGGSDDFNKAPNICAFPLSYYNVDYEKYDYKLGAIVLFVQNHVNLTRDNPKLNERNILQHYNNNNKAISGKTVYFIKNELDKDVNELSKIKPNYNGPVKIVTEEEILEIINRKDANAVFLHKVGPPENSSKKSRCFKLLIGAADGFLYYTDYHKIGSKKPDAFLKSDFKSLTKQ